MSLHKSNTLQTINFSPLNNSKSKAMFTFSKSNRFVENKQPTPSFYQKPSELSKRATSFGYGVKSDLISKYLNTPSPDQYQKKSDFQLSPKKGITIGLGRQNCKSVSIFNFAKNPSPMDYICKDNKQNAAAYSIRPKLKLPGLFPQSKTPGPAQYNNFNIKQDGKCFVSKYRSSKSFKIHTRSSSSIQKVDSPALGPLSYKTELPSTGKQILSKKKTEKSFFFDRKPRITMQVQSTAPGPGAYTTFSQFNR